MSEDDDLIEGEDLLIEAARYAVQIECPRNRFMSLAKKAWFQAATEAGVNPQLVSVKLRAPAA
jgi:hypothetical protein